MLPCYAITDKFSVFILKLAGKLLVIKAIKKPKSLVRKAVRDAQDTRQREDVLDVSRQDRCCYVAVHQLVLMA